MIASNTRNSEVFTFIAVLIFKLLSRHALFINRKDNRNLKCRLLFNKITNFTGKLQENYKWLECEIFKILLKHVSDHLSVLFQFA